MHEDILQRVVAGVERTGARELVEAAEREGEFGVEVEGGGGEAAARGRELGGEEELEAELGLSAAALGDDLGDGAAGDAASEAAVEDGATGGALLGEPGTDAKALRCH